MTSANPYGTILPRGFSVGSVLFPMRRIGDLVTLRYGKALQAQYRVAGPVPVYGTNGRCGWHAESLSDGPGTILGRKGQGHLGVEWCEGPFWVIDTAYYAEMDPNVIDPLWFYYITSYVGLDHLKTGEKPGLSRDVFGSQLFPTPDFQEQKRIGRFLRGLDEKIQLNHQMNETLESLATAFFKAWFVDFEPVNARLERRRPVGMDADVAGLFPSGFRDTELGPIPIGWNWRRLDEVFEINPRRVVPKGAIAPYVDMQSLPTTGHAPEHWTFREAGSGARFKNGDTLLARITPCLENGKTAYVDFLEPVEIAWGSTEYIVLRARPPIPLQVSYLLARSEDFRDHAIRSMTGSSGRQRVELSDLVRYVVPVAPECVNLAFGEITEPLFKLARENNRESRTLTALRELLLPRLLSGEMRLSDAERQVASAA